MVELLYGYSFDQWAEMGAYFAVTERYLPLPGLAGADIVSEHWRSNRVSEPTGAPIIFGVLKPMEPGWALRLFHVAAIECAPMMRPDRRNKERRKV